MAIFNSYVSLPEGISCYPPILVLGTTTFDHLRHHSMFAKQVEQVTGPFPPTPSVEGATYELDVYDLDFWRERLMEERLGLKEEKLGHGGGFLATGRLVVWVTLL